jgi:hypothetical protein
MRTLPSSRHQAIEVFRNNASMPEGRIPQIAAGAAQGQIRPWRRVRGAGHGPSLDAVRRATSFVRNSMPCASAATMASPSYGGPARPPSLVARVIHESDTRSRGIRVQQRYWPNCHGAKRPCKQGVFSVRGTVPAGARSRGTSDMLRTQPRGRPGPAARPPRQRPRRTMTTSALDCRRAEAGMG